MKKVKVLDFQGTELDIIDLENEKYLKKVAIDRGFNNWSEDDIDPEFKDNYDFEKGRPKLMNYNQFILYWDCTASFQDQIFFHPI